MKIVSYATAFATLTALPASAVNFVWDGPSTPTNSTYSYFDTVNWVGGIIPIDGAGNIADTEVDNVQRTYDINNGGAGINMPNSRLDIGRGVYFDSSGADDGIIADEIRFNGAGGQAPTINVPVVASTFSSNRHGAVFNEPITVDTILAESAHQDKWQINAVPTGTVTYLSANERRGADGGNIDGFFRTNVDMSITTIDHVWSSLEVGPGATLTAGTYNYTFYDNNPNNAPANQNINPLKLDGDMNVETFNMIDIATGTPEQQPDGTWGAIGSAADNEVAWITGDGILTVGTGLNTDLVITDIQLLENDMISLTWSSKSTETYTISFSEDMTSFDENVGINFASQGDSTTHIFENPTANPGPTTTKLFFQVSENNP